MGGCTHRDGETIGETDDYVSNDVGGLVMEEVSA